MKKSKLIALLEAIPGDFDVACYDELEEAGMRPQRVVVVESEDDFPHVLRYSRWIGCPNSLRRIWQDGQPCTRYEL